MTRTRTNQPNATWSMKTLAFVCPRRDGNFEPKGLFSGTPCRPRKAEGGPLRR